MIGFNLGSLLKHLKILFFLGTTLITSWEGLGLGSCLLIKPCLKREFLWRQVTVGKFGDEPGGWCSLVGKKGYGVGLWKALRGGWEAFKARTIFIVGNRRRTKFWLDVLYEDAPLKDSFPFLFSFASNKKAWVVST